MCKEKRKQRSNWREKIAIKLSLPFLILVNSRSRKTINATSSIFHYACLFISEREWERKTKGLVRQRAPSSPLEFFKGCVGEEEHLYEKQEWDARRERGGGIQEEIGLSWTKTIGLVFCFQLPPIFSSLLKLYARSKTDPVPRKTHTHTHLFFNCILHAQTRSSHLLCPMVRFNLFPRTASRMLNIAW